jgi:hypothetical protein
MAKTKTKGMKRAAAEKKKDPKRAHIRAQLLRNHSFLRIDYRELKSDELEDKNVFFELFPKVGLSNMDTIKFTLKAIYEFQN